MMDFAMAHRFVEEGDPALPEQESLYTAAQEMVLIITPYFTAPLSVLGSGLILYVIIAERKRRLKETYNRLMLGLSSLNFMNSLGMVVLGHWTVPTYIDLPGAAGTARTCSISGFFLNLIFGAMWYSFFLSLCFALRIKCECRERCIARWAENFGHLFGFLFPVFTGIVYAVEDEMNPMVQLPGWCWTHDYPSGCQENEDIDCIRGDGYEAGASAGTIILLWIGIIICMVLIVIKVRHTEQRLRNYAGGRNNSLVRTRQSGIQALWYIGVFFVVYGPIVGIMFLGNDFTAHSKGLYFAFAFLTKLLSPLQGFFNALVYFRRSFRSLTQQGRTLSCLRPIVERLAPPRSPATRVESTVTRTTAIGSSNTAGEEGERCSTVCSSEIIRASGGVEEAGAAIGDSVESASFDNKAATDGTDAEEP